MRLRLPFSLAAVFVGVAEFSYATPGQSAAPTVELYPTTRNARVDGSSPQLLTWPPPAPSNNVSAVRPCVLVGATGVWVHLFLLHCFKSQPNPQFTSRFTAQPNTYPPRPSSPFPTATRTSTLVRRPAWPTSMRTRVRPRAGRCARPSRSTRPRKRRHAWRWWIRSTRSTRSPRPAPQAEWSHGLPPHAPTTRTAASMASAVRTTYVFATPRGQATAVRFSTCPLPRDATQASAS